MTIPNIVISNDAVNRIASCAARIAQAGEIAKEAAQERSAAAIALVVTVTCELAGMPRTKTGKPAAESRRAVFDALLEAGVNGNETTGNAKRYWDISAHLLRWAENDGVVMMFDALSQALEREGADSLNKVSRLVGLVRDFSIPEKCANLVFGAPNKKTGLRPVTDDDIEDIESLVNEVIAKLRVTLREVKVQEEAAREAKEKGEKFEAALKRLTSV